MIRISRKGIIRRINKKNLVFAVIATVILVILLLVVDPVAKLMPTPQLNVEYRTLTALSSDSLPIFEPSLIKSKENPINGVMMTEDDYNEMISRSPVAITMNNYTSARPQYGLTQADVVLEVLAEGGITRYVPIYLQHYDVQKIGPVRSVRYYMLEYISGYNDPILLHEGQAGFAGLPTEKYNARTDAITAMIKWKIKDMRSAASRYRDLEKAKKDGYVHSLYTDFGRIAPEIARYQKAVGWTLGSKDLDPLKFKFEDKLEDRGDFKSVTVSFLSLSKDQYACKFVYNKLTNSYDRYIGGKEDIDLLNNTQVSPKNVVIELHNYGDSHDGHSRIIIDMIGEDSAYILRDGKVIEGRWKKDCRTCRTKYFDANAKEIELNRGQIWIVNAVKVGSRKVSDITFEK